MMRLFFLMALGIVLMAQSPRALALQPDEMLKDPALEARAREVSKDIRCVVCQNQSIDDSDSGIARNMRVLVRDRILQGDSNTEVKDYLVSRYGDFVLLKPPVKAKTYALWFGPVVMVLIGMVGIFFFYRRRSSEDEMQMAKVTATPLSQKDQERLEALMKEEDS